MEADWFARGVLLPDGWSAGERKQEIAVPGCCGRLQVQAKNANDSVADGLLSPKSQCVRFS
jgi:hypothetical protein